MVRSSSFVVAVVDRAHTFLQLCLAVVVVAGWSPYNIKIEPQPQSAAPTNDDELELFKGTEPGGKSIIPIMNINV